jgi:hypothetical protein
VSDRRARVWWIGWNDLRAALLHSVPCLSVGDRMRILSADSPNAYLKDNDVECGRQRALDASP